MDWRRDVASTAKLTRERVLRWTPEDPKRNPWLRETFSGLCLRVRRDRHDEWRREYFVCYRWNGRPRYQRLGLVASIPLDKARKEALAIRSKVEEAARKHEPNPLEVAQAEAITLEDFAPLYQRLTVKSEKQKKEDQTRWNKHILPFQPPTESRALRHMWMHKIDPLMLEELKLSLARTKTTSNRVFSLLSHAFNMAAEWGKIPASAFAAGWTNPTGAVKPYPERSRTDVYSSEEIVALLESLDFLITKALDEAEGTGAPALYASMRAKSLLAIRLMAFNGSRPGEILKTERKWILWDRRVIDLPSAKGDRKVIKGRLIPFGRRRMEDLKILARLAGNSPFLLPGRHDPNRHMATGGYDRMWTLLKETADERHGTALTGDETAIVYTWRHTIVSAHNEPEIGVDAATIGDMVGHSSRSTTQIYRHANIRRLTETAQLVEDWLCGHHEA